MVNAQAGRGSETNLRTVAAAVVETVQAPPAVVFLQALQCQIPTAVRLTESCVSRFPCRQYPRCFSATKSPFPDACNPARVIVPGSDGATTGEKIETNLAAEGAAEWEEYDQFVSLRIPRL